MLDLDTSQAGCAPARAERLLICALAPTGRPGRSGQAADIAAAETRETLGAALAALSDRVMWLDAGATGASDATLGALLDLGRCPEPEALAICARLITRLGRDLGDARPSAPALALPRRSPVWRRCWPRRERPARSAQAG